ncbi:MAG TPA: DUF397 domain-containing protein [Streptosporangiaceae bacterium]|nr:DUF397 domain-containing protein [Streptosporangiaceae bacterium]
MSAPHGPVDRGPVYNGMPANALIGVVWHKSRCSSPQGECVEMARLASGDVAIRNSRHPDGSALIYTRAEIEAFILGVKDGDFDHFIDAGRARA